MDFGIVATIGNKLDINETDMLSEVSQDKNIKRHLHVPGVGQGREAFRRRGQAGLNDQTCDRTEVRANRGREEGSNFSHCLAGGERSGLFRSVFGRAG